MEKSKETRRAIHKIDARDMSLGRLSTKIAILLQGKNKPQYQPNIDIGDFVHIINIGKVKLTGKKSQSMVYHRHSGQPGKLKTIPVARYLSKNPEIVLKKAVDKMLPKNKFRATRLRRLMFVKK